jgi:hypothetical protein
MIEQVFENLRRATEFNIRTQQRLFKKWAGMYGAPMPNGTTEQIARAQDQWTEFVTSLIKKQRETIEPHFKNGLKILEEACCLVDAKDPEEVRAKVVELWQKAFQSVRQLCEAQIYDFEAAVTKWVELVTKIPVPEEEEHGLPVG